jgi:hypothetical protein
MAVIYIKHPKHGYKVACGEMEAEADKANGWVDFDPVAPKPLPAFFGKAPTLLPEGFPAREWLIKAGYTTLESIPRDAEELSKIDRIGNATALKVLDALEG